LITIRSPSCLSALPIFPVFFPGKRKVSFYCEDIPSPILEISMRISWTGFFLVRLLFWDAENVYSFFRWRKSCPQGPTCVKNDSLLIRLLSAVNLFPAQVPISLSDFSSECRSSISNRLPFRTRPFFPHNPLPCRRNRFGSLI